MPISTAEKTFPTSDYHNKEKVGGRLIFLENAWVFHEEKPGDGWITRIGPVGQSYSYTAHGASRRSSKCTTLTTPMNSKC